MLKLKEQLRALVRLTGYEIARIQTAPVGFHKYNDLRRQMGPVARPVIFDVGANTGQTVIALKGQFPDAEVHSFEPSPTVFQELSRAVAPFSGLHLNNFALGRAAGRQAFMENSSSEMSSFLSPDKECWGEIVNQPLVEIRSLDGYCAEKKIERIDLLKVDTQGYDLEVLAGAEEMMRRRRVRLVLAELTFSELYQGAPAVDEIMRRLREHGFKLVAFYNMHYRHGVADWCDALFTIETEA